MLQGESHVSQSQILLLCNSICHLSHFAERSQKSKKRNDITPHVVSLGRLCKHQRISRTHRQAAPRVWQVKFWKKNFWKEIKESKSGVLRKKSYMYMHCFFKFLARVNQRINSLTFKTENTKTLTYNFSFLIV